MPVETKAALVSLLRAQDAQIRAFGVQRLGRFGSFLRGRPDVRSDVDLLVEFQPGRKTFDNFMGLAWFLEGLLGRRVELVTPESLSPFIGPRILEEVEYVQPRR